VLLVLICTSTGVLAICERELDKVVAEDFKREGSKATSLYDMRRMHEHVLKNHQRDRGTTSGAHLLEDAIQNHKLALKFGPEHDGPFIRARLLMIACALGGNVDAITSSAAAAPATAVTSKNQSNNPDQSSQQNQAAQQQSQQAQQLAQQNQASADQARQGKRKTHDPAAEAHECISIDNAGSGNFGAFKNSCGYKVNFSTCNYKPRIRQGGFNWSADFDCEKGQYGLHTPSAGVSVAAHNRNTEMVYWFACKHPAYPVDTEFTAGSGVRGRCN
jgi:hypothetical protein